MLDAASGITGFPPPSAATGIAGSLSLGGCACLELVLDLFEIGLAIMRIDIHKLILFTMLVWQMVGRVPLLLRSTMV